MTCVMIFGAACVYEHILPWPCARKHTLLVHVSIHYLRAHGHGSIRALSAQSVYSLSLFPHPPARRYALRTVTAHTLNPNPKCQPETSFTHELTTGTRAARPDRPGEGWCSATLAACHCARYISTIYRYQM
jgi:hypothetical protein